MPNIDRDDENATRYEQPEVSLEKQIEWARKWYLGNSVTDAILASLERLKQAESRVRKLEDGLREPTKEMEEAFMSAVYWDETHQHKFSDGCVAMLNVLLRKEK